MAKRFFGYSSGFSLNHPRCIFFGFVIKNAGESFVLKKSNFTSQSFSVTGFHQKGEKWSLSRNKIFPDANGRIQVRFDDGACDNSFVTSPDLKVTIKID